MRCSPARLIVWMLLISGAAPLAAWAQAEGGGVPTQVMVRAVAHDAKILGDAVGGARIVIQEAATGRVLAEGIQRGGTGDTGKIITEPMVRGASIYDTDGAAGFLATVVLDRPTQVDVTAYGPLEPAHALQRTTKRLLLVPGLHVLGDGILLDLNGFIVELVTPQPEAMPAAGASLAVRAKVVMLCSCPTTPGGLWDADAITVTARLLGADAHVAAEAVLTYAGEPSTYAGMLTPGAAGAYTLEVVAADAGKGNFGMVERRVVVAGE